jgi:NADPH:quinone reductase-like Zn-dependent oxidoreductase
MKAAVFHEFGSPDVLRVEDVPLPEPNAGQVRIRVHAVSVNQTLDVGLRRGEAGINVKLPMIPGLDPSGVVDAVGPEVTALSVGDRVVASLPPPVGGGYAEHAVAGATSVTPIPAALDFPLATAIARHLPTAFSQFRVAKIQPGESVLVMGAAGALASCMVQLCKEAGATVIGGAGTDERVQAAMSLGADHGINYRRSSLVDEVMSLTEGKGVQVVLENVGEPDLWQQAIAALGRGGRLFTVGTHGGSGVLPLDVRLLYRNRLRIQSGLEERNPDRSETHRALQGAADGKYRMLIDRVLPLAEAAEAHRLVEENRAVGKVIIDPTLPDRR